MAEHTQPLSSMPFKPSSRLQLAYMPKFDNNEVPRYLFRVHDRSSADTTTSSYVVTPAGASGNPQRHCDIFSLPHEAARDRLHGHLKWVPSHQKTCNLTSWTSSLLFALQYGFYRNQCGWTRSPWSEINVMILDTRGFPKGTFVKDMEIMEAILSDARASNKQRAFLNLRRHPTKGGEKHYFGEYLSQGRLNLDGRCAQTTLEKLRDLGLSDFQEGFGGKLWAKTVLNLRVPLERYAPVRSATDAEVGMAFRLASGSFGYDWAAPVALMLLAMKPYATGDPAIIEGIAKFFTHEEIRRQLGDSQVDGDRLPELGSYEYFVENLLHHIERAEPPSHASLVAAREVALAYPRPPVVAEHPVQHETGLEQGLGALSIASGTT